MTPTCGESCIICDIDGFTGINNSNSQGQAPPGFCTSQVHHMQWIAFIAGTQDIKIELSVFNCTKGEGLEVGIYEGVNCENFKLVTECDTDIPANTKRIFKNTKPLTIGQYYFWVMDGSNNDVCSYTIKVLEGSTKVPPLTVPAPIELPDNVCEQKEMIFTTQGIEGATIYDWSVNGVAVTSGNVMKYIFPTAGEYTLCLDARNVCDKGPQNCIKINVNPAKKSSFEQEICFGECYEYYGGKYCETGHYTAVLPAVNGCDSTVTINLKVMDQITTYQSLTICEGDTLMLGDGSFSVPGTFTANVVEADGCQIKVILDLSVINCKVKTQSSAQNVSCNNFNNGQLTLQVTLGTPPFMCTWQKIENPSVKGSTIVQQLNQSITIDQLDEGNYKIETTDAVGNVSFSYQHIKQPPKINCEFTFSDFNGYAVPCIEKEIGTALATVTGGNGGYTYAWSSGQESAYIDNLKGGLYTLIVYDKNNCSRSFMAELLAPEKLKLVLESYNPDCTGGKSGYIDASLSTGGTPPYSYSFNGSKFSPTSKKDKLGEGKYSVLINDVNGCEDSKTDSLIAAEIPRIQYTEAFSIELGDSIDINILSNLNDQTVSWNPPANVLCPSCLQTYIRPVDSTTYEVIITSKDGCEATATIAVDVIKNYSFVVSSAISPNSDGFNDRLRYNAKKDVEAVLYYEVYDRWGNKVYQIKNGKNGLVDLDWEGTFSGKKLAEGSYVWLASVSYIDGKVINYLGSLLIVR
jgi:gliding motility-associated-like protein